MRINLVIQRLSDIAYNFPKRRRISARLPFIILIDACQYCGFCCKGCKTLYYSRNEGKFYCGEYLDIISERPSREILKHSYCRGFVCYELSHLGRLKYDIRTGVFLRERIGGRYGQYGHYFIKEIIKPRNYLRRFFPKIRRK